ncbi:anthranilate synthase component I family protein [Candidatus Rariloculus sp.]|uniref:anthranilate synthase component I family protein n=1 Tax=Candidatus Rariloculus sp. TaxID=3101265 RepID=UPI003D0A1927
MEAPFDIAADLDTPVSAYLKLRPFKPRFLLESVESAERLARYSFLGLGEALTLEFRSDTNEVLVDGAARPRPGSAAQWLELMREALSLSPQLKPEIPGIPFNGGLVGAAGYDVVRYFERLPANRAELTGLPQGAFVAPRSVLVFDHLTRRVALLHAGSEAERQALRTEVVKALRGGVSTVSRRHGFSKAESSFAKRDFLDAVARCKTHISAGDIYQIVLSSRFSGRSDLDPFQTYRGMRLLNPSPYMFFFELGGLKVAGSSPEALVRLDAREASLRPIAGTRPRGTTPADDLGLEQELLADPKEGAEHVMLVDLARNDLGRVAQAGSVHVDPYRKIERYSHVMHIVSGVRGQLAGDHDALDLFAAAFPAGTLVGAPKVRAMEIIAGLEPVARGLYGGTVGYFAKNGNMDQAITIRTMVFNGDEYSFQAGAGIVADSVPEREHDEVLAKSAILRRSLELAEEGL